MLPVKVVANKPHRPSVVAGQEKETTIHQVFVLSNPARWIWISLRRLTKNVGQIPTKIKKNFAILVKNWWQNCKVVFSRPGSHFGRCWYNGVYAPQSTTSGKTEDQYDPDDRRGLFAPDLFCSDIPNYHS